jgi:hypothetical protein
MVGADEHPLIEFIEDVVLWPFRLARWGVQAVKPRPRHAVRASRRVSHPQRKARTGRRIFISLN